jgi:hypothetical protein
MHGLGSRDDLEKGIIQYATEIVRDHTNIDNITQYLQERAVIKIMEVRKSGVTPQSVHIGTDEIIHNLEQ